MPENTTATQPVYQPELVGVPPLYAWPPRPRAALRYLLIDLLYPWGFVYIALAFPVCWYLTPALATMATFEPGWIAFLWLRNCALLFLFAGGLHWWFHRRRGQGDSYMINRKTLAADSRRFLWRNQVRDNMLWSIASGVTAWTAWEAVSYWVYATGRLPIPQNPWYFVATLYLLFFWSTTNFYFVHRFLHWQPVYRHMHELHHRNIDVGPWTGISMHPLEHLLYFSPFLLWWFVPVHPVIIVLTGFYQGLNPALSHSGFDCLSVGGKLRVKTGDWFHHLHHQYFDLNYGNTPTPFDKLFGSWHDGSSHSLKVQRERTRMRRKKKRLPTDGE